MPRSLNKLSDVKARSLSKRGRHSDGGGLYLNVSLAGTKSWVFLWSRDGRSREMGLGPYPLVTLSNARARANQCRLAVLEGRDPIAEKQKETEPTFGECADRYIASAQPQWRNDKHIAQWSQTLTDYCGPIRAIRVSQVDTAGVLKCLQPIWLTKNETASRLRGRIERVLDYAKSMGWRDGENPAAWRGHLKNVLPKRQKLQRGHHAAMPYSDVPAFLERLPEDAMSARAIELLILTAARSGEILNARWEEFDLDRGLWTVPAERMKRAREHRVPLVPRAFELMRGLHETRTGEWVFPGAKKDRPLSNMAMQQLMQRMGNGQYTPHGFRSAFRDWVGDETRFSRELAEAALAHKVGDETEQAYRRSDALEKRRKMMMAWADYLVGSKASNVVRMRSHGS